MDNPLSRQRVRESRGKVMPPTTLQFLGSIDPQAGGFLGRFSPGETVSSLAVGHAPLEPPERRSLSLPSDLCVCLSHSQAVVYGSDRCGCLCVCVRNTDLLSPTKAQALLMVTWCDGGQGEHCINECVCD